MQGYMNFNDFKAGTWKKQYQYKSFSPVLINHGWLWDDPSINILLESATRALGELNAFSFIIPNVDLFIEMHIAKEAHTSSRIEGTRTSFETELMPEDAIAPEMRDDWHEVRNYVAAMNMAIQELPHMPVSTRLLCRAHAILMQGVRGQNKNPGEYRRSQNWIGGSGPMDAAFVPPHHDEVPELMGDLEKFLHNEDIEVPDLVRAAIAHYQFETIHPFSDGNGRVGRLLITLYLVSRGILQKPTLYLSDFFERNRSSYIDSLMRVRTANDIGHWVRFFLAGVLEISKKGRETFQSIQALREEVAHQCLGLGRRAQKAERVLTVLYRSPIVSARDIETELDVTSATANAIIRELVKLNILREITGMRRHRLYVFDRYLRLLTD